LEDSISPRFAADLGCHGGGGSVAVVGGGGGGNGVRRRIKKHITIRGTPLIRRCDNEDQALILNVTTLATRRHTNEL
jgi:hypothetical protein